MLELKDGKRYVTRNGLVVRVVKDFNAKPDEYYHYLNTDAAVGSQWYSKDGRVFQQDGRESEYDIIGELEPEKATLAADEREQDAAPDIFHRNRKTLNPALLGLIDTVKTEAEKLYYLFESRPDCRETAIAKTKLEEAVTWYVKGLTKLGD